MTVSDVISLLASITALIAAIGGFWKINKDAQKQRDTFSAQSIATHFENQEKHSKRQDDAISTLTQRVDASIAREREMGDYVYQLRQHIAEGKPPPPPEWPTSLLHPNS